MNYIWDLLIHAEEQGIPASSITFVPAQSYSPYMELSLNELNATEVGQQVELNPYYRFETLFKNWFHPDLQEDEEMRTVLFDMIIHFLAQIDRYEGMTRREYEIRFVLRDLEQGVFGDEAAQYIGMLNRDEQEQLGEQLLRLYETGEPIALLRQLLRRWFPRSLIYVNRDERQEMLVYLGQPDHESNRAKVNILLLLFVPIPFEVRMYWAHHFGLVGTDETMKIDNIALY
ncbi:iron-dependent peroxidase [Paenibacillus hunanensis]|uniref:iron-dependent peroxidase n=1 Tax=Paenibacillus hunanensis TaxID=539262 RepID=UPI002A6A24B2|nr:iron-dependent peroxidase [Paenibacillus hunanensis]WPP42967.1 iron-dependent peroxidase [Paenibacillus hunanensis]